ncbi:hypothetical protein K491DRAFT_694444 [Lophiostoma macrostomum CBS 122681]|uniref:Uncharacterized protein n=1 Tax=Lophiostoma macrostomum CBS 122681 TaxID=1314788 RepID=A0A6A6T471_9PLEO|nr:hypothetical protein K491DRAFT_694444 [Lophiostoma macrostomum CBS 122681]
MSSTPSTIHLYSSSHSAKPATHHFIIYFVPGNPGLVAYYQTFLTHLYGLLSNANTSIAGKSSSSPSSQSGSLNRNLSSRNVSFEIFGRSLSGFETNNKGQWNKSAPYNVEQQIAQSEQVLRNVVEAAKANGKRDVRVILMGHSLGTYICLEMIRRSREEAASRVQMQKNGITNRDRDESDEAKGKCNIRIVGGALLFATVVELAKSPSGVKSKHLLALPYFPLAIHLLAKLLTFFLPTFLLTSLIQLVMRFPHDGAHVTASFVTSPHGVYQALYMANDEMTALSTDKWDAEIWGAANPSTHPHSRPVLRFLFGKHDHWIANETRDDLIKARGTRGPQHAGHEDWRPVMEVDEEEGWEHGFCIRQSVSVAERVKGYIDDIVRRDFEAESNS